MPRLLLVDDNPSIHRIAESLLAPTDIELVCVASAAEALDRLGSGERFDVALVDTAMPGMDGWTLLSRMRAMEATARMPIALMAGVLDPVDPAKLAKAPIQGFLKKPIELRELGDRVKTLLATPVVIAPSPFSTVPAVPAKDLMQRPEVTLPEYRPDPVEAAAESLVFDEDFLPVEDDLLLLNAEDLWPEEASLPHEEAPAAVLPVVPEPSSGLATADVQLELEELDLDSLQDLTDEALPTFEPVPGQPAYAPPADILALEPAAAMIPASDSDLDLASLDVVMEDEHLVTMSGLEELDAFPEDFPLPTPTTLAPLAGPESELSPEELAVDLGDDFDDFPVAALSAESGVAGLAAQPSPEATPEVPPPALRQEGFAAPVVLPAAVGQVPAVSGQAVPNEQAQALVQALLADPVLVDALVKAVVVRMGDQVLREIAWEVMPDLAGRLQR